MSGIRAWLGAERSSEGRLRAPIRIKFFFVLLLLGAASAGVVLSTLISFFNQDKATYIQDLNADLASNTAASVSLLLGLYEDRLLRTAASYDGAADAALRLTDAFEKNEDLVYLAIYDQDRRNVLNLCRESALAAAGVDIAQFRAQRDRLEESPDYLRARGSVVRNASPSPALTTFALTLAFEQPNLGSRLVARGEYRSDHLLRAIHRTPGFLTYVVDSHGAVFLHPDPAVMAALASFAERRVVAAMLANMGLTAAGTGEFAEAGEQPVLASFAAVGDHGLGVIVERPRRASSLAPPLLVSRPTRAGLWMVAIAAVFAVILSRTLTAPLLDLSHAARRLEKGDFAVRVVPRTDDELGDLARSFNLAAAGLSERDDRLKETYEQLLQSEKLAGFGKFSAGIAHEIKNPLMGIIGFAQILSRKLPEGDPRKAPLQMIEKEAKRCKSILDNLLKFTRKEGLQFEPVFLHEHLRETLELVRPQLGINQVEAVFEPGAPRDLIKGDPNQLRQVFMNLILNAVDAMEKSPTRRIRLSTAAAEPGYLEVVVADSGEGIPEDKIRKIFDPFFTTKEPGKGTGLGLSVTYGILSHHGGRISVKSQVGEGTEFRIVLPEATADVVAAAARNRRASETTPVPGSLVAASGG